MKEEPTPITDEFYAGLNTDLDPKTEREELVRFARRLERRARQLVKALDAIASWNEGPRVKPSFDEPAAAAKARLALAEWGAQKLEGKPEEPTAAIPTPRTDLVCEELLPLSAQIPTSPDVGGLVGQIVAELAEHACQLERELIIERRNHAMLLSQRRAKCPKS